MDARLIKTKEVLNQIKNLKSRIKLLDGYLKEETIKRINELYNTISERDVRNLDKLEKMKNHMRFYKKKL